MDRAGVRLGAPKAPAAGSPHWKSGRRNSSETSQQLSGLAGLVSLGNGHPLSEGDRRFFDSRFGFDFSRVRVHADAAAAETAAALDAAAFTIGSHIVFGRDRYRPGSGSGKALLAHELTHVVQQSV
ncbi:MAG TPA: DUF4157 domain-containing protein, partial [Steroidobacteraceae bacterium]|nr:DUF4157 domain-containing protein [Steroidobacteraceae bacterium]